MKRLILSTVCMLFCATGLWAQEFIDGIYYNLNASTQTASVTNRLHGDFPASGSYSGSITIPSTVAYNGTSYIVTSIGNNSFGYGAFESNYGLTSVTIPNSVTRIEYSAFYGCTGLTSIDVAEDNTNYSSTDGVLYDKEKKTLIKCPAGKTSIEIPNSVTNIESRAFEGCETLTSIEIPNSVTNIGNEAFKGCKALTNIEIPNSVTSIGSSVFGGCTGLTSVTIPNGVTSIGSSAFSGCSGLTSITIPNSVTSIGSYAFGGCTGLTSINVAEDNLNYASIDGVLYNKDKNTLIMCPYGKMGSITIPNSVTSIGSSAFSNCSGLASITLPNSVTSIGSSAFYNCTGLKEVINKSELNIAKGTSYNGYVAYYADYVYNGGKTVIGDFIFSDRDKTLKKYTGDGGDVTLPKDFNGDNYKIGDIAFYNCQKLTGITIPNSVTSVESGAFVGCSNINKADINSQVALDAISFTDKLSSIKLGDNITSIGSSKFFGCTGLTDITIPSSVTNIGASAFAGCSGLTEIICEGETPAGSNTIFGEGGEAGKIYVKALLKVPSQWFKLYKVTEPWCRFDMTASDFDMVVIPYENKAVFTWTPITGAEAYELTVIEKETGEALCSLNFDAYGRLRGLVLRNDSEKTYVGGYDFTVTSLRGDVEYDYTMEVKDISDNVIESMSGTFRTSDGVATATPETEESIVETARYDINGRPLNAPTKGVNIVKYSDGSFEKEFVR